MRRRYFMPKFAVYYIPHKKDRLYQFGSSILGYDIRSGSETDGSTDFMHLEHERFDPKWADRSRPYGFHLTIGPAVDFDIGDLRKIEHELENLISCLNPALPFRLQKREADFVSLFGEKKDSAVLRYEANEIFKMFHTLIISRMNPLGCGTRELRSYLQDDAGISEQDYRGNRLLTFYYKEILEEWRPHFTLLTPYTGDNQKELVHALSTTFEEFNEINVDSICLVVQMDENKPFKIYKEFDLPWKM
jgi:hypothetical protein